MKHLFILLVTLLTTQSITAQFIKEKSINAKIGYGLSSPYYSTEDIVDSGFYLQGELVLKVTSWFELRPYLGFISTNSNGKDLNDQPTAEKSEVKAVLVGGKTRIRIPIPYFAPYTEIGFGTSIGKTETLTYFTNINKKGLIYHIPFSIGVELGKRHKIDIGLTYYFQPSAEQYIGAAAIGVKIPL